MKWTSVTLDLSKIRRFSNNVANAGKTFVSLIVCTVVFFTVLGIGTYMKDRAGSSPSSSMKGLAASVSSGFFLDMLGMEVPHLTDDKTITTFSQKNVFGFLFRMITDINPSDPKTMLAHEVPGFGRPDATLLRCKSCDPSDAPVDYTTTSDPGQTGGAAPTPTSAASPSPSASPAPAADPGKPTTGGRNVVMIYHSHNRESFLPEIGKKDPNQAYDPVTNITLVGKRLQEQLQQLGVGTALYDTDYNSTVKDFNYAYSYKYSATTVKEAMATNPDIKFIFDIHRDSDIRTKTTLNFEGKDYAQVFFIIGQKNPNWKENEKFAAQVQDALDKKIPNLAKGIWGKSAKEGNAEYNQSVSPDSVLIEIGGPYNTLEECYRTADVLASVISELYWDATKANAPAAGAKQ